MMKKYSKITNLLLCFAILLALLPSSLKVAEANKTDNRTRVIVSMGDSYSSGEGIPDFYDQYLSAEEKKNSDDWLGHRSTKSWSSRLTLDGEAMERNENWYFVASSGAVTHDINYPQKIKYKRDGYDTYCYPKAQIKVFDEIGSDKKIEYVTLTLGGNDMGFSKIVTEASLGGYFVKGTLPDLLAETWDEFYKGGIKEEIKQAYKDIYAAAKKNNPDVKIIVAGYPNLVGGDGEAQLTKKDVELIRSAGAQFNRELEMIINECKAEGMRICFVPVDGQNGFAGHEAYAGGLFNKDTEYIRRIEMLKNENDLDESGLGSTYSMHPNDKGAEVYANLVQEKINQIEEDGGESEWPGMGGSKERDAVLVLDTSSSMNGTPMNETKKASNSFIETILYEEAAVGIVTYSSNASTLTDFNKNVDYLKNVVQNIHTSGMTNIEAGLMEAEEMLSESVAEKKFIVLMSDGQPNEGKEGDELVNYAKILKDKGIKIYTLGFFSGMSDKTEAQALMEKIASEGCHFEVDDAEQLKFFFEDIAEQIRGTRYQYIRIACPVDVKVSYGGETLSSKDAAGTQRTAFGTLTFEENPEPSKNGNDNRIKILRLKEGASYDVKIKGNGSGKMDYTIGFMDENGEYSDMRRFSNIKITKKTEIDTVAAKTETTSLKIDEDGDGKYDIIYKADKNGRGKKVDYMPTFWALLTPVFVLLFIIVVMIVVAIIKRKMKKTA